MKRSNASAVARVYDALGWHAPAVLIVKILLRELWQLHLVWDDEVPENIAKELNCWRNELPLLNNYPIQRCQFNTSKEVHSWEILDSVMLLKKPMHAQSISGQYTVTHLSPHH